MPFLKATEIRKIHEGKIREQEQEREKKILSMMISPNFDVVQNPDRFSVQEDDTNKVKGNKYELYVGSFTGKVKTLILISFLWSCLFSLCL